MQRLARLRALSPRDRRLLAEAMATLALAALAVALLPLRTIGAFVGRPARRTASGTARASAVARVRWAVIACASRAPFRAKCFEQGLAAVWLLRRRGVSATLHFGAAREQEKLIAHVWVTVDGEDVIGGENKDRFFELARFPGTANSAVR